MTPVFALISQTLVVTIIIGAFSDLPIRDYTQANLDNVEPRIDDNLVVISDVTVTDFAVDTTSSLIPAVNTPTDGGNSDRADAYGWVLLLGLSILQQTRAC